MGLLKKLLIVEDEPTCQILLTQALATKYKLEVASSLTRAKGFLKVETPDLILLDFHLPDGNAFELIEFLKDSEALCAVPIILLTQESAVQIKVRSFAEGVYDFVTKPFNAAELNARIEAHLSRAQIVQSTHYKAQKVGDIELDSEAQSISIKKVGQESTLNLSPIEFKILQYLINHSGKVRTREQLALVVWKRKYFQSRTIDRHISSIRKKLGTSADCLQTVSQGGYRLTENSNTTEIQMEIL